MGEGRRKRRRRVEPTDDWKQLKLLFGWPEQVRYEELRPLVLFGSSVAERAIEIEAVERERFTVGWTASRPRGWRVSSTRRRPDTGSCRPP